MIFSRRSWSQTSPEIKNNYIFIDEKIISDTNLNNTIKYYESILKNLYQIKDFGYQIYIVLPDLYHLYNYNLLLNDQTDETLARKRISNLGFFAKKANKLGASIITTLNFNNISSLSQLLRHENETNSNEENYHETDKQITYNDLLYTQNVILFPDDNGDNALLEDLKALESFFQKELNSTGIFIEALSSYLSNEQNMINDEKIKFLKETLNSFKEQKGFEIKFYETNERYLPIIKKIISPDKVFVKFWIDKQFKKITKKVVDLSSQNYNVVVDTNIFIKKDTNTKLFKLTQFKNLMDHLSFETTALSFKYCFSNETHHFTDVEYADLFNNYIHGIMYRRNGLIKLSSLDLSKIKKHKIKLFNNVEIIKFNYEAQQYIMLFNNSNRVKKNYIINKINKKNDLNIDDHLMPYQSIFKKVA
ncbi:hypothetical protein H9M94_01630 [Mycoplasma sp. Pen4]|uniref:hypothetical protein n=1 Tax=Mycoplasma sp. Pen4 TaxID=640330 RepID=UPI0016542268|nr:hypothetical protein [Mycoplasma sp. Pen4]QNM93313.1 hypothetical protein H9M94_01630 [Mycoplasma sp. Pen4]